MKLRRALRLIMERFVEREVIGQEVCPLMLRWTLLDWGFVKAMIHYFPAEVSDRDPHDHPRPFVTLVLRGNYRDESWVRIAGGTEPDEAQIGEIVKERIDAGAFRYRPATHLHIVETDAVGCWTLVVMGPIVREWGFVRLASGSWWPWGKYVQKFGGVIRCDAPADTMNVEVIHVDEPGELKMVHEPGEIEFTFEAELDAQAYREAFGGDYPLAPPPQSIVPRVGDFVMVCDPAGVPGNWSGKVENVLGETAWVRDSEHHAVRSVKVDLLYKAPDEAALIERYYRRSGGA